MDRPLKGKSLYNPQAAHLAVESLKEIGYVSESVQCDLEYVRHPVGFPTDLSNGVLLYCSPIISTHPRLPSELCLNPHTASAMKDTEITHRSPLHVLLDTLQCSRASPFPAHGWCERGWDCDDSRKILNRICGAELHKRDNEQPLSEMLEVWKATLGRALDLDSGSTATIGSLLSREVKSKLWLIR